MSIYRLLVALPYSINDAISDRGQGVMEPREQDQDRA